MFIAVFDIFSSFSLAPKSASPKCAKGVGGFEAKIFVLRPEGVPLYVERAKTEIENDFDLKEKFAEFQPNNTYAQLIYCLLGF